MCCQAIKFSPDVAPTPPSCIFFKACCQTLKFLPNMAPTPPTFPPPHPKCHLPTLPIKLHEKNMKNQIKTISAVLRQKPTSQLPSLNQLPMTKTHRRPRAVFLRRLQTKATAQVKPEHVFCTSKKSAHSAEDLMGGRGSEEGRRRRRRRATRRRNAMRGQVQKDDGARMREQVDKNDGANAKNP